MCLHGTKCFFFMFMYRERYKNIVFSTETQQDWRDSNHTVPWRKCTSPCGQSIRLPQALTIHHCPSPGFYQVMAGKLETDITCLNVRYLKEIPDSSNMYFIPPLTWVLGNLEAHSSPGQDEVVAGADVTQHLPQLKLQLADGPHSVLDGKDYTAEHSAPFRIQIIILTRGQICVNLFSSINPCHYIKTHVYQTFCIDLCTYCEWQTRC